MVKVNSTRFVELLRRSGLVEEDQVEAALEECKRRHGNALPDAPEAIADVFLDRGLLTAWHTKKLLDGKYRGFYLGKYKLLSHIATGGMSSVYLAEHTLLQRKRAIKVLPRSRVEDSSYLARFHQEAQATAALDHANIVRAYDIDREGDTHYLVMEYVEGRDLQSIVREDGLPDYVTVADYVLQTAEGLQHAHDAGLIHRDVKPANLLVDPEGTIKILDLGLALFSDTNRASLTMAFSENVLGTADYLAPEQALNSHSVDHRADIYALGCTMYYLLTDHPPFPDGTLAQRIAKHQNEMPPSIRGQRQDCPPELEAICFMMIQKQFQRRYQSMNEVADALQAWLETQHVAVDDSGQVISAENRDATAAKRPSRGGGSSRRLAYRSGGSGRSKSKSDAGQSSSKRDRSGKAPTDSVSNARSDTIAFEGITSPVVSPESPPTSPKPAPPSDPDVPSSSIEKQTPGKNHNAGHPPAAVPSPPPSTEAGSQAAGNQAAPKSTASHQTAPSDRSTASELPASKTGDTLQRRPIRGRRREQLHWLKSVSRWYWIAAGAAAALLIVLLLALLYLLLVTRSDEPPPADPPPRDTAQIEFLPPSVLDAG